MFSKTLLYHNDSLADFYFFFPNLKVFLIQKKKMCLFWLMNLSSLTASKRYFLPNLCCPNKLFCLKGGII